MSIGNDPTEYALHRSRLTEQSLAEARHQAVLEERNRIALDIHDTLAQGCAGDPDATPVGAARRRIVRDRLPYPCHQHGRNGLDCHDLRLKNGKCADVRIAIGGVAAVPVRAKAAEKVILGQAPTAANIEKAAAAIVLKDPLTDNYACGEFRTHQAKVMTKRALTQ